MRVSAASTAPPPEHSFLECRAALLQPYAASMSCATGRMQHCQGAHACRASAVWQVTWILATGHELGGCKIWDGRSGPAVPVGSIPSPGQGPCR